MKGLAWRLNSLAFFSIIVNIIISTEALELTADGLLDEKEKELTRFVGAVEANSHNCDALKGCSSSDGNCSRLACYKYGTKGDPNYQCLHNDVNNSICGSQCTQRNFDFTKSFVRRVDPLNAHIAQTVCTHRTLDDHFKNSSMGDSSHLFRVFFGAVDGTARLFPGVDEDCNTLYDPRLRPWFIESTYVRKGVTVLVDSGLSMRDKPAGANTTGETYLTKAKTTALTVVETLREDTEDYVNVACFDGPDGIKPPNAKSSTYNQSVLSQALSDRLDGIVSSGSTIDPSAADTGNAIRAAISEMERSIPGAYLKVVIVLTTGQQFQALSELNIPANSSTRLFVYNFRTAARDAECNGTTASSEGIPVERFDNPLYALESYYSFLARTRRSFMGNNTDYGQKYPDASGIDYNTLTISKAAFEPFGELLGVVGIDFFEKEVEEKYKPLKFGSIVDAARRRAPQKTFDASKDPIPSVCFNHTNACSGLQTTAMDGICQEKNGDAEIGCCGKCKSKKREWGEILGGAAGGIVGLLVIAAIVYYSRLVIAKRLEDEKNVESPKFSGSDDEITLHRDDMSTGNLGLSAPG